ncbi:946_t:CDS:1, partial [Paraglomus occultum]
RTPRDSIVPGSVMEWTGYQEVSVLHFLYEAPANIDLKVI